MTALREKTVILVTHQVEFLSEVDAILVKYLIWMHVTLISYMINMNHLVSHLDACYITFVYDLHESFGVSYMINMNHLVYRSQVCMFSM